MDLSLILIIGGGLVVVLIAVGLVVSSGEDRSLVDKRVNQYWEAENPGKKEKSSPVGEWFNARAERSSWGSNMAKALARADLKLKVGEYIAVMVISSIGTAVIVYIIGHQNLLIAGAGAAAGLFLPRIYVNMQQGKRLTKFSDQLADMLNLMVNGLRAGYSTMQAMEAVSKELPPPICDEFRRVVQEMQLGVSMETALDNLLRRIPSPDLDLVITAVNVQREVGGNLAEILASISHTIRERVRIKGEIKVLTSQVMYSGRFLSFMPIGLAGVLYLLSPSYFGKFFDEPKIIGIIAFILVGVLIGVGNFVMSKIGDIEI